MGNLLGIGCLIYAIYLAISKKLPYRKEVMLKKGTENTCLKIEIIAFICLFLVFEMMYLISFFIRGSIILGIFYLILIIAIWSIKENRERKLYKERYRR